MTKPQLLKLNDQLTLWMEQVADLTEQFNGSGNLTDDVHQFSRDHKRGGTGHVTDVLLKSMSLHGVLTALQFEVTEVILKGKKGVG